MTHTIKTIIISLAALLSLTACSLSAPSADEEMAVAQKAIRSGDYQLALTTLDNFANATDSITSPSLLARMAVMYMIINEHISDSNADLQAIDCFRRASRISSDSVVAVFQSLPPEEAQYLFMLKMLTGSIDNASAISLDDTDFSEFANPETDPQNEL